MTKKKNSSKIKAPEAPAAPAEPAATEENEPIGKKVTFPHDQRKIDLLRIRQHTFLEMDLDKEEIEKKVADAGFDYEINDTGKWFIIWVKV